MSKKENKNKIKNVFYSILTLIIISSFIGILIYGGEDKYLSPSFSKMADRLLEDGKKTDDYDVNIKPLIPVRLQPSVYYKANEKEIIAAKEKREKEAEIKKEKIREEQEGNSWITMNATNYVANCKGCTGYTNYKGWDVRNTIYSPNGYRVIAVDPNFIKLGSLVEIRYKDVRFKARAMDIGGAINGNDIDILVSSKNEAYNFGVQTVELRIIQ
ncbi:3D domain-containing protein [Paraliobacillus ryukyuensis]|uniref:3D domain-containing protein n=1 Tax=Paraliobacillus ryukyuensis TaxID=200904 RepID=UPI0009A67F5C|nr:3D domain-containing protein [Paraliobacillus ryukyuensis]